MRNPKDKLFLFAACGTAMAGMAVLTRFALTGEILVRRGWATLGEQPFSVAISLVTFAVLTMVACGCAYLQWTGSKVSDARLRSLDQRRLLDTARRQDEEGRDVSPSAPSWTPRR